MHTRRSRCAIVWKASNAAAPAATAAPAAAPSGNAYEAASKGTGFTVGNMMAVRQIYVFFDPQCPHCGHLWEAAKPLATYREEELAQMRRNFYGFDPSYHVARHHFVRKSPASWTPRHLARHRELGWVVP